MDEHKKRNPLDKEEKVMLNNILKDVINDHLILTQKHEESNAIGCELAYYFGEDGLDYYLTIRKQRKGFDELISTTKYLNICKWIDNSTYKREGKIQTIKHYYYRALNEYNNKCAASITCGTFQKITE